MARARKRKVIGNDDGILLHLDVTCEALLDFGDERLEKLDATHATILGGDDVPGGIGGIGELEQFVDDGIDLVVVLVLVEILVVDAPGSVLIRLECLDALGLLLFADVEEQLDDEVAIGDELPLENLGGLGKQTRLAIARLYDVIDMIANLGLRQMAEPLSPLIMPERFLMISEYQLLSKKVMVPYWPMRSQKRFMSG